MNIMKKLVGGLLLAGAMSSLTILVFAYTPAQPKPGFVVDYSVNNVASYEGGFGTSGTSLFSIRGNRNVILLNSGVSRYVNPNTGNYYASGATTVINRITRESVYHTTTVQLVKGKTVLVEGKASGLGEVWTTTPETTTHSMYWLTKKSPENKAQK